MSNIEERIKKLEEKVDKLTNIIERYLEFWLNGTGLAPIYQSFIDEIKQIS